ncbi:hypothetical protein BD779DRAFT_1680722 [Infundibulicybe gibba]|nr:hypothetical protein BD779DRAFT_1680722 [Infundibulicybe gibba]
MSHTISTSTLMLLVAPRHHSPSLYIASSRYHIPICPRRLLTPSAAIVSPPCNAHASSSCPRMLPVTLSLTTTPRRFIHVASNVTAHIPGPALHPRASSPRPSAVIHPSAGPIASPDHHCSSPASLPAYPLASLHSPATSSVVSPSRPPTHLVCSRVPIPDPAPRSRVLSRVLFSVVAARNRDIFLWYLIALGPVAFSSGLYS